MAKSFQVVENDVVTNVIMADDGASLSQGAILIPGLDAPMAPMPGASFMAQDGAAMGWLLTGGVLVAPTPPEPVLDKEQLSEFANLFQWRLATGGHNVSIGGASYRFATDPGSLNLITAKAMRLQQSGAPASVDWQFASGFVTIAAADFIAANQNIADWFQSTFDALKVVAAAIEAGSITTKAQVRAASWPAA